MLPLKCNAKPVKLSNAVYTWTVTYGDEWEFSGVKLYKYKTKILHKRNICTENCPCWEILPVLLLTKISRRQLRNGIKGKVVPVLR
jgi:hypothetical protein